MLGRKQDLIFKPIDFIKKFVGIEDEDSHILFCKHEESNPKYPQLLACSKVISRFMHWYYNQWAFLQLCSLPDKTMSTIRKILYPLWQKFMPIKQSVFYKKQSVFFRAKFWKPPPTTADLLCYKKTASAIFFTTKASPTTAENW